MPLSPPVNLPAIIPPPSVGAATNPCPPSKEDGGCPQTCPPPQPDCYCPRTSPCEPTSTIPARSRVPTLQPFRGIRERIARHPLDAMIATSITGLSLVPTLGMLACFASGFVSRGSTWRTRLVGAVGCAANLAVSSGFTSGHPALAMAGLLTCSVCTATNALTLMGR